ncbi:MAG TPA: HAD family hydrolase [Ignavibacteriaceae bacterium]|nr:HAD family hydrolase [Ignavibacteriaceae bacterium]
MVNKILKDLKLILFDLDGTLLAEDGTIGEKTKYYVKELRNKGVEFTFASGRLHSAILDYAKELDITLPIISLDGCLLRKITNNEIVFESFVKEKHVKRALNYSTNFVLNIALCHADAIYFTENNSVIPQIMDKFGARYEEVKSYDNYLDKTLEVVIASDNKDAIKYVQQRMMEPYCWGLNNSYFKSQSHEGIYYLELRKKGSSKGKGFLRLIKELKIKQKNAAIIGDWYNDISLFETNALKVAVKNAVPEIKRMADIITDLTNNEDGVSEFLEMVYKAKQ